MIITPQRTIGYLVSENFVSPQISTTTDISDFIVFRYDWREEPSQEIDSNITDMILDEQQLAKLYADSAEEDIEMAKAGIDDYARLLEIEDHGV